MSDASENSYKIDLENVVEKEGEELTFTLADILQEQREMEEDAAAVLGGSDANCCTYNQGYIKRQALYACLTCVPEAKTNEKKRAGVCLACTYRCHDGHELIELYTKRNFRCDCGTSKILSIRCKLDPMKMEDNNLNTYNQNFSGVYCTCHRPYPDPEDTIDDEMIQCVLCEDWYHSRHLESKVPDVSAFEEMICSACTKRTHFLQYYAEQSIMAADDLDKTDQSMVEDVVNDTASKLDEANVDNVEIESTSIADSDTNDRDLRSDDAVNTENDQKSADGSLIDLESSAKKLSGGGEKADQGTDADSNKDTLVLDKPVVEATNEITVETAAQNTTEPSTAGAQAAVSKPPLSREEEILDAELNQCIREIIEINNKNTMNTESDGDAADQQPPRKKAKLCDDRSTELAEEGATSSTICIKPKTIAKPLIGSSFWPADWRKSLCKCSNCLQLYKELKVEYLTDLEDTVLFYQNKGISKMEHERHYNLNVHALNNLDHVGRIEVMMGYNKLKEKLTEFLTSFIGSQRVVTVDDVNGFFQKMRESDAEEKDK